MCTSILGFFLNSFKKELLTVTGIKLDLCAACTGAVWLLLVFHFTTLTRILLLKYLCVNRLCVRGIKLQNPWLVSSDKPLSFRLRFLSPCQPHFLAIMCLLVTRLFLLLVIKIFDPTAPKILHSHHHYSLVIIILRQGFP